jgi:hypothetical protein
VVTDDQLVVPAASTARLLARFAPRVATIRVIPGTVHNTIAGTPDHRDALQWPDQ